MSCCHTCHGDAVIDCRGCDDRGSVRCTRCDEEGRDADGVRCSRCAGRGRIDCVRCDGRGSEPCLRCGGTGDEEEGAEVRVEVLRRLLPPELLRAVATEAPRVFRHDVLNRDGSAADAGTAPSSWRVWFYDEPPRAVARYMRPCERPLGAMSSGVLLAFEPDRTHWLEVMHEAAIARRAA